MADRFRALLDRPLDPSAAWAILVLASAILVGFTAILLLAASQPERPTSPQRGSAAAAPPPASAAPPRPPSPAERRQDPQDVRGSVAARRAARALRSHRALQHVPYRLGELTITLIGARGDRALLSVRADTMQAARDGWLGFLRRYRDSGRAYVPIFKAAPRGGA